MKKVKLSFPPEEWDFNKYFPHNKCIWGEYEFYLNQEIEECDFWLICGNLNNQTERVFVPIENVVFNTSESSDIVNYSNKFLNQFSIVSSFRSDLPHSNLIKSVPIIPWFVKKNYDELSKLPSITKTKCMSLLASDKQISVNHIKRLNFVKKIHKYFGDAIDVYGAGFTDYVNDKTPTHDPYMFSIILETIEVPEYFSEKLGDCYLSFCFPVYYGCSNLSMYFNPSANRKIDINDFDTSAKTIKALINNSHFYESRQEVLLEAKNKYLTEYSIVPAMVRILDQVQVLNKYKILHRQEKELVKYIQKDYLRRILNRVTTKVYGLSSCK